jgi:hypothetical protein
MQFQVYRRGERPFLQGTGHDRQNIFLQATHPVPVWYKYVLDKGIDSQVHKILKRPSRNQFQVLQWATFSQRESYQNKWLRNGRFCSSDGGRCVLIRGIYLRLHSWKWKSFIRGKVLSIFYVHVTTEEEWVCPPQKWFCPSINSKWQFCDKHLRCVQLSLFQPTMFRSSLLVI